MTSKENISEDRFSKLTKRILSEPDNTPEESERYKLEREAAKGTRWEWAQMQDDGIIGVHTSMYDLDGSHGTGGFVVSPDDKDYEKAKEQYGLSKPGDTYHQKQKVVNGEWVTVLEERPGQKPQTGEARSA